MSFNVIRLCLDMHAILLKSIPKYWVTGLVQLTWFFFWSNSINLVEPLVSGEELAETNWVVPIFKHNRFNILF